MLFSINLPPIILFPNKHPHLYLKTILLNATQSLSLKCYILGIAPGKTMSDNPFKV